MTKLPCNLYKCIRPDQSKDWLTRVRFFTTDKDRGGEIDFDVHVQQINDSYLVKPNGKNNDIGGLTVYKYEDFNNFYVDPNPDWSDTSTLVKRKGLNGLDRKRRFFCYYLPEGTSLPTQYDIHYTILQ